MKNSKLQQPKLKTKRIAAVIAAKAEAAKEMDALRAKLAEISNSFLSKIEEKPHARNNQKESRHSS